MLNKIKWNYHMFMARLFIKNTKLWRYHILKATRLMHEIFQETIKKMESWA